jgi:site-specific DNA-cytosine methylase
LKVLVACEFSGTVRDVFIERGHDAVSCDIIPSEKPGPHTQDDVLKHLSDGWDLMIAHPPCTDLSKAGARWWPEKEADGRIEVGVKFVRALRNAPIPKIAIENPVGILTKRLRKPTQIIEPYQFGDPWQKATCLWLYNLPRLVPTNVVVPEGHWVDTGSTKGIHRDPKKRALTFPGIAAAMAAQWGGLI